MIVGLLFLAGTAGLVVVLAAVKPKDATQVVPLVSTLLTVAVLVNSLLLWWYRRRTDPPEAVDDLRRARQKLAGAIKAQWTQEAQERSLGHPAPMPVCWELAGSPVMHYPGDGGGGELSFAGRSDEAGSLAAQFRRLERRRLVILGGPGSGKTTLAMQLLLELLDKPDKPQDGEPIPVLMSLSGWNPKRPFLTWFAARLVESYPLLRAFGPTTAQDLTQQGHLLPILDGLDELPESHQHQAINALNKWLAGTRSLVLCGRTTDYTRMVTDETQPCELSSAVVIEPQPLTPAQAAEYLSRCLPDSAVHASVQSSACSWKRLFDLLRTNSAEHLTPVVTTPLGLWLLRTVYIEPRADPTPLLIPGPTPVLADLFDQLIAAVVRSRPATPEELATAEEHATSGKQAVSGDIVRPRRSWDPNKVRKWLRFLAQHLHDTGTRDLHWWQLARNHHITPRAVSLAVGAMVGGAFGLAVAVIFGMISGPMAGVPGGLLLGLLLGLIFGSLFGPPAHRWLSEDAPAYANLRFRHRFVLLTQQLVIGVAVGMSVGTVVGLALGLAAYLIGALSAGLSGALMIGLSGGGTVGLIGGLVIGLITWVGLPSSDDWATGPQSTYRATRTLTLLQLTLALLTILTIVGSIGWLASQLTGSRTFGLADGLQIGAMNGLASGLAGGLAARRRGQLVIRTGAWLCYILAIWRLAATRKLPLRLMSFLDDAHRLGLLHTVGPAYQFRHAEFQDHLVRPLETPDPLVRCNRAAGDRRR